MGWVIGFVGTYSFPLLLLPQFEVFAVFPQFLFYVIFDDRKLMLCVYTEFVPWLRIAVSVGPSRVGAAPPFAMRTAADPVLETLGCF
jgi:hypothetical protein